MLSSLMPTLQIVSGALRQVPNSLYITARYLNFEKELSTRSENIRLSNLNITIPGPGHRDVDYLREGPYSGYVSRTKKK